ncbi:hypothetical protein V8E53_005458 [Lactarius tabidus]
MLNNMLFTARANMPMQGIATANSSASYAGTPDIRQETCQPTEEADDTDLIPTQQEGPPITTAGLPQKKNQCKKGHRPKPANQFMALDADSAAHPADPKNHLSYWEPLPMSGITGWGDEQPPSKEESYAAQTNYR